MRLKGIVHRQMKTIWSFTRLSFHRPELFILWNTKADIPHYYIEYFAWLADWVIVKHPLSFIFFCFFCFLGKL